MTKKAVLITGAAIRVGRHIALHFAHNGWDVALHYNNSKKDAEQVAVEIRALNVKCELLQADLADSASYESLVKRAHQAFPALTTLVNNASVFDRGSFLESGEALYEKEFRINTTAPIFLTQAFAKIIGKGSVVNMLDTKITKHKHSYFFYLLSKKTLAEFTQMAALELAPNIRVNGVCPGHVLASDGWGDEYQKRLEAKLPLGRIATLDEVADAVYSLANDEAANGQLVFVDGGEHLI